MRVLGIDPGATRSLDLINKDVRILLEQIAEDGTEFVVAEKVRNMMRDWEIASLWLLHDPGLAAIPWELFRTGSKTWGRSFPMARHPRLGEYRQPRPFKLRPGEKLRIVIVRDDSGDLPETASETKRVAEELNLLSGRIEIKVFGHQANSVDVRGYIKRCHILHFAGHVVFPEHSGDLSDSGWLLKGQLEDHRSWNLLRPSELRELWKEKPPFLVFANGCHSAASHPLRLQQRTNSRATMDLAEACLSQGVSAYIGAVWEAPDNEPTAEFAAILYRHLVTGLTVSEAALKARDEIAAQFGEEDLTWARYVVCGDPFLRLPFDVD